MNFYFNKYLLLYNVLYVLDGDFHKAELEVIQNIHSLSYLSRGNMFNLRWPVHTMPEWHGGHRLIMIPWRPFHNPWHADNTDWSVCNPQLILAVLRQHTPRSISLYKSYFLDHNWTRSEVSSPQITKTQAHIQWHIQLIGNCFEKIIMR